MLEEAQALSMLEMGSYRDAVEQLRYRSLDRPQEGVQQAG